MSAHFWSIKKLAERMDLSLETMRQIVMAEPDVWTRPGPSGKRFTYRIPDEVAERIIRRYQNPGRAA